MEHFTQKHFNAFFPISVGHFEYSLGKYEIELNVRVDREQKYSIKAFPVQFGCASFQALFQTLFQACTNI